MATSNQPVVLITGCSSGIGRALVGEFAERGHRVMATARSVASLDGLEGERVSTAALDVTDAESIDRAVSACLEWAGRIDLLVNNAGYGLIGPMAEVPVDELRVQFETNVIGLVATTQAVVPHMAARASGRIVNIGSVSGVTATPFGGSYSGTKAAVHLLSDALRLELAPLGIDVVVVQPGAVGTEFAATAGQGLDRYRGSSLYGRVFEGIAARAGMSANRPTPAEEFARRLVQVVTRESVPAVVRLGRGSILLPAIGRLPTRWRDRFLSRKFGLDRLRQA